MIILLINYPVSFLVTRFGAKAITHHNKIFVIGGYDGTRQLKTVEVYDPLKSPYWQLQVGLSMKWFFSVEKENKVLISPKQVRPFEKEKYTNNCQVIDWKTSET